MSRMEKKRPPVLAGYDLAIAKVKDLYEAKTGRKHGAMTWLADKLEISRQALDNWGERNGFPPKFAAKVAKITGFPVHWVRPKTVQIEMIEEDYLGLDQPIKDRSTIITNQRNRHG
jgi:hypothetical protein